MQKYRHKRTGAVIEVNGILTGKDWEAVKAPQKAPAKEKAEKKETK